MEPAVEDVVSILEDDAFRRGGSVTYDRILALCSKHQLPPGAISIVKNALGERDVEIEMPDEIPDESPEGSDTAEPKEGASGSEVEEPSEGAPPEIVRDILASYFRSAQQFKRLTVQEELAFARRIHAGLAATQQHATLNPDTTVEGLSELIADGRRARDALIEANLLLVPFVAKSIEGREQLPFEDLVQEGNLGLMKAVERFEGGHDAKFSTYAAWWIWSFMKRSVVNRGRLVRLPVHFAERVATLKKARHALTREQNGVPPSVSDLADHLGWRIEHVIFALQSIDNPIVSIDAPIGDGATSFAERLHASEIPPDAAMAQREEKRVLEDLVESLGEKMAHVLKLRFGLGGTRPHTLEDLGAEMNVTRERIRQIEKAALRKLRHRSRSKFWTLFGISPASIQDAADKDQEEAAAKAAAKAATKDEEKG